MTVKTLRFALAALIAGGIAGTVAPAPAVAADLPKSTQEMLKEIKKDASLLKGLDKALNVPKSMLDAARKEGQVRITATFDPQQFRDFIRPFEERYPGIDVNYFRASRYDRVIKPLIALKSGRVIVDAIIGFGGQGSQFEKLNALVNLADLPVYEQVPQFVKSPSGNMIGHRIQVRCFSYNADRVKKSELPKTWEDIVNSDRWKDKNLAVVNRPDHWALHLWVTNGEDWTKSLLNKLFLETEPQLRKEGENAALKLLGAGEFDALIGGTVHVASTLIKKGTPISVHCPDPITPGSMTPVGIVKGGNENAARLFVNWLLSREGQVAQLYSAGYAPVYSDLQEAGLGAVPGVKIDDNKRVFYHEDLWSKEKAQLVKFWDDLWFKGQGLKMATVKVRISAVKRGGRRYYFKVDGKEQKVRVSSSSTVVTIDGNRIGRKSVQTGMTCEITYPGDDQTAKEVACTK